MNKDLDMRTRRQIGRVMAEKYQKARKKEKTRILDEFTGITKYVRGYAKWLLRNWGRRIVIWRGKQRLVVIGQRPRDQKRKRKRPVIYDEKVLDALKRIWQILDFLSGKRLAPYLKEIIPVLEKNQELVIDEETRQKLLQMSAATIDRLLKEERKKWKGKGKCRTKPGTLLKSQIPVRTFAEWNENKPGFVEMDLVSHDGGDGSGIFAQTLDVTDVFTGWTETIAVDNKSQARVFAGIVEIRDRLPFPLLGIDCDSGGEFINYHLQKYCQQEHLTFTRSRAYNKNDGCYVEQKNWSIVRRAVGYWRYEMPEEVDLLNQIYQRLRLYTNFFQPQMKCCEKTRIGSKVKKRYDTAKTPYRRILENENISTAAKVTLRAQYRCLNPVQLKREIAQYESQLFDAVYRKARLKKQKEKTHELEPVFG
jgi:hypothetical protein